MLRVAAAADEQNINGLLRQYFPKGTDLGVRDESALRVVQDRLNHRRRKSSTGEHALRSSPGPAALVGLQATLCHHEPSPLRRSLESANGHSDQR
jgi:hypothetical protein